MNDKIEAFRRRAPKFRKRDIDDINALFDSYIFRRKSTGEVWTTCCRRHEILPADHELWDEIHIREPRSVYDNDPILKETTPCPFCGRQGKVKDLKYTGRRENLCQYRRFVLLRWDGSALWADCAEAKKEYTDLRMLTAAPTAHERALYRFGKDAVEHVSRGWYGEYSEVYRDAYKCFNKKTVCEPFTYNTNEGMCYRVIGADALDKTPIRYCYAGRWVRAEQDVIKRIHLAYVYPRQVEMLMKADMEKVVWDLARNGVKHYTVLDWTQSDPRKAFKVPQQAVKAFLSLPQSGGRDIGILEFWKHLNRTEKIGMETAREIYDFYSCHPGAKQKAQHWGVPLARLYRYFDSQWHCNMSAACGAWMDYVDMAAAQGLALHRSDVILPADLRERHDAMVEERNRRLQAERDRREAEWRRERAAEKEREEMARKARGKSYAELRKKLERKYAWAADGYQIIIPDGEKAIEDEGRILKHCVAGYAQRHVEGKTVILFMRKAKTPDKPWLTIEMWGTELHQIHGYRNEGLYTTKGRFAPDPREKYRDFLDPWLEWVKAGSRRKKDGTPIVPKTKKESAA